MIYKKFFREYIEGKVPSAVFLSSLFDEKIALYEWLQTIVPTGKMYRMCHAHVNEYGQNAHVLGVSPYDVRNVINHLLSICRGQVNCTHYYIHRELSSLWKEAFPDDEIEISDYYRERFFLELDYIPRYIGGTAIYEHKIIDDILDSIPKQLSHAEQRNWCQDQVNRIFHLEDGKHPYWREEPTWPIGEGHNPMRFLLQENENEAHIYLFQDVTTGEVHKVIQVG